MSASSGALMPSLREDGLAISSLNSADVSSSSFAPDLFQ